jgi:hypothetical protein
VITVEDLIIKLATTFPPGPVQSFDYNFANSLTQQLWAGNALTEKQAAVALKIIKKYQKKLTQVLGIDVATFLLNPIYKYPFREQRAVKKISVVVNDSENIVGKTIKVEFPYNETYILRFQESRSKLDVAFWNQEKKTWVFNLSEKNINFLKSFATAENFDCDEEFLEIADQQQKIIDNFENHVPTLCADNGIPFYKNAPAHLPVLKSTEILPAIFEAINSGVNIWDDEIGKHIESLKNPVLKDFLNNNHNQPINVDRKKHNISTLKEIITYLKPCLFVIPPEKELENLQHCVEFLNDIGISRERMSVLFRLPDSTGRQFNEYIKNHTLNNPLNDNTEIVFIDGKVPKPLFKAKINFNCIVNLGYMNPHYTCKFLVSGHQHLIYFTETPDQKNLNWWETYLEP